MNIYEKGNIKMFTTHFPFSYVARVIQDIVKPTDIIMVDNSSHDRSNNPLHFINSEQMEVRGKQLYPSNITVICIHMYVGC